MTGQIVPHNPAASVRGPSHSTKKRKTPVLDARGAAIPMRAKDVYVQQRRLWVGLREKGGKAHVMPCHHTLKAFLHAYSIRRT